MPDKKLFCKDCGKEFVFTESEQAFFKEKGFDNEPVRCATCRKERKQQKSGGNNSYGGGGRSGGGGYGGGGGRSGGGGGYGGKKSW